MCLCLSLILSFNYFSSITIRSFVSIDRFWAVCYPISYLGRKRLTKTLFVLFSWVLPITTTVLVGITWKSRNEYENSINSCFAAKLIGFNYDMLVVWYTCANFLLIILLYGKILHTVHKQVSYLNLGK